MTDARGVHPMLFRQFSLSSIELRQSTRSSYNRKSVRFQSLQQCPSSRIHSRSIFQRLLCLRFNLGKTKLRGSQIAFLLIVFVEGNREIARPVRSSSRFWDDMLDFQVLITWAF